MVEQILRRDPAEMYARSTFATRDRYRHMVERLARQSGQSEVDVAWQAITLASSSRLPTQPRVIGMSAIYLVGDGRDMLECKDRGKATPDRSFAHDRRTPTNAPFIWVRSRREQVLIVASGLRALLPQALAHDKIARGDCTLSHSSQRHREGHRQLGDDEDPASTRAATA